MTKQGAAREDETVCEDETVGFKMPLGRQVCLAVEVSEGGGCTLVAVGDRTRGSKGRHDCSKSLP